MKKKPIYSLVTDIEGTTSSITFVHDVLFPYAYEQMESFIKNNGTNPAIAAILDEARNELNDQNLSNPELIDQFKIWIQKDLKIPALKNIQGHIWAKGYSNGDFKAHIYPDAMDALRQWHSKYDLWVYSSGSVKAQALFFTHSTYGDILSLFKGLFDTSIGQKKEIQSYQTIYESVKANNPAIQSPESVLFLSDVVEELDAAWEAGFQTYWIIRAKDNTNHSKHPIAHSFAEIQLK